jgi:hypothetical protein
MDIENYLLQGFNILPQTLATVNGVAVSGVFNQSSHRDEKLLGGFGPTDEAVFSVKQSLLPTDSTSLKGKIVVLNNRSWRIMQVRYGQTITHLTITSPEQA